MRRDLENYRWRRRPRTKDDAQVRQRGEQTGLDTTVVHAVNDVYLEVGARGVASGANALSIEPHEVRPQG